jgi:hypothetical protein
MTLFERHWRSILVGFAAAALGGIATLGLDDSELTIAAGAALAAVAGVYVGFGVADGRTSAIAIQTVSMFAFAIVAYIGIEESSKALIGAGWVAHGFWDAIHHEHDGPTEVKTWYPPFCATADLVIGIPLIAGVA